MGHYDDMDRRETPLAGIISLILLVLVFIGVLVYLILFDEVPEPQVIYTTPTTVEVEIEEEKVDWEGMYDQVMAIYSSLSLEHESLKEEKAALEEEYRRRVKDIEDGYSSQISAIEKRIDEYKRTYEELEAFVNELITELKDM